MKRLVVALALAAPLTVSAVERVVVLGLFKDMAIVKIDGVQRKLKTGEASPEGVRLIGSDSQKATLEIDGVRDEYRLGQDVHTQMSAPVRPRVQISRSPAGMYQSVGSINGVTVNFLVDTGASSVAMGEAQARRLGIDYRVTGQPMAVGTASGVARAWHVMLDRVKLGSIELRNVEAAVIEGGGPGEVLLGMSFLSRLKIHDTGQLLELEPKF